MKDITRIHIAKVPYSIELTAKKELEKYIDTLELYTGDHEVMDDIEIRITELLLERRVKSEDVITQTDVTAIRAQLGEPKDFLSEETGLDAESALVEKGVGRKLYRNEDKAVLGGVMAGIGTYFGVNALWIRLAFVILSFASLGLFILLYIVLWLVVPAAKTAAEKLQLSGQPVTLASIRELNEGTRSVDTARRIRIQKRVATLFLGAFGVLGAVMTAIGLVVTLGINPVSGVRFSLGDQYRIPVLLAAGAGILLIVLCVIIAVAAFSQKFNKRIWISAIVVIVLGLGSFGTAIGLASYQRQQEYATIQRDTVTTDIPTPKAYASVQHLSIDVPSIVNVQYIVDAKAKTISQRSLKSSPLVTVSVENGTLSLTLQNADQLNRIAENTVTLYGPQLQSISVNSGYVTYSAGTQSDLSVAVHNSATLRLNGSGFASVNADVYDAGQFVGDEAAIATVKASVYGQGSVNLGNIKNFDVTYPEACAANQPADVTVENILSPTYRKNGVATTVASVQTPCIAITFSSDQTDNTYQN